MIGIYIGPYSGNKSSPMSRITRDVIAANGSNLSIFGVGEDVTFDESSNASLWSLRVGGSLANSTANRFSKSVVSGRVAITSASTDAKSFGKTTGLYKSLWVVAQSPAQPFATYYQAIEARNNPSAVLICNNGGTGWYTSGVARSFYQDGAISGTVNASGLHIYESLFTSTEQASGVDFAGDIALARAWTAPLYAVLAFTVAPTVQQRADTIAALKSYYSIP